MTSKTLVKQGVYVSVLELFSIGIGPSSSHTVGPMRAAKMFRQELLASGLLQIIHKYSCVLHGSLAATGVGHGTPDAIIAGLRGYNPETVAPEAVHGHWERLVAKEIIYIDQVPLTREDITFEPFTRHFGHPNALTLSAFSDTELLYQRSYLSIGGGFVEPADFGEAEKPETAIPVSYYRNMAELLQLCQQTNGGTIADIAWRDEIAIHGADTATEGIARIWATMRECIERGLVTGGTLPGGLQVPRRAAKAWAEINRHKKTPTQSEALLLYAMAVNEENAAGSRVVTAPTNGAAGVLPAVLYYSLGDHLDDHELAQTFLLTATAIGSIIKANASISGAEGGCQAEVGSACAMAAAGLTAIRGGSPSQVENAAEIAIEHHLGLTCDPVSGLVQIPCIERNAVASIQAINAARMALHGDGAHHVSLDQVIKTMRETGADMKTKYKETARGGLAVNIIEC